MKYVSIKPSECQGYSNKVIFSTSSELLVHGRRCWGPGKCMNFSSEDFQFNSRKLSNFLNTFGFILVSAGKLWLPIHKDLSAKVLHCSTAENHFLAVYTIGFFYLSSNFLPKTSLRCFTEAFLVMRNYHTWRDVFYCVLGFFKLKNCPKFLI